MSVLGWIALLLISAVLFRRAALTAQDDELHASLAQVISGAMYLTLLIFGSFEAVVFFSAAGALQFYYLPTAYQRRRHEYYPEALLPYINFGIACSEVVIWFIFQQIR